MELLQGKVQRLRLGTETVGNGGQIATTHVATLQMAKVPIRLEMPGAIMLSDGDGLVVAGVSGKDGVFTGYAYRNLDNGARGQTCGVAHLLVGTVLASIGLVAGLIALGALAGVAGKEIELRLTVGAFAGIFALSFGGAGFKALRLFGRTARAVGALR